MPRTNSELFFFFFWCKNVWFVDSDFKWMWLHHKLICNYFKQMQISNKTFFFHFNHFVIRISETWPFSSINPWINGFNREWRKKHARTVHLNEWNSISFISKYCEQRSAEFQMSLLLKCRSSAGWVCTSSALNKLKWNDWNEKLNNWKFDIPYDGSA